MFEKNWVKGSFRMGSSCLSKEKPSQKDLEKAEVILRNILFLDESEVELHNFVDVYDVPNFDTICFFFNVISALSTICAPFQKQK